MRHLAFIILSTVPLLAGCANTNGWHPNRDTVLIGESNATGTDKEQTFSTFQNGPKMGTLYLYDQGSERLIYLAVVPARSTIRLYNDSAVVVSDDLLRGENPPKSLDRWIVARYPAGHHIKAYYLITYVGMPDPTGPGFTPATAPERH